MAELYSVTVSNADLRTERLLLQYTYTDDRPLEVLARVDLGDVPGPIAGNGAYTVSVYINDILLSPNSTVLVKAGVTKTIIASRPIPLKQDDVLKIKALGLAGDAAVNVKVSLRDQTPLVLEDVVGTGSVVVDHDYGGTDALFVKNQVNNAPIDGATILVFRQTDYAAGLRSQDHALAITTTDVNGRWKNPAMLSPGNYTLLIHKSGAIKPRTYALVVS